VDLIPQSGAAEEGSLNNRVYSLERVRYILERFMPGEMTDMYLAVEFTNDESYQKFRRVFGPGPDVDEEEEALAVCKKNFQSLLRILKDPSGNLYQYNERQNDFMALNRWLQTTSLDKAALLNFKLIDNSEDTIFAGIRLHAVTGNHSSAAAQLWKLGVDPNPKTNPNLDRHIIKPGFSQETRQERQSLARTAQVYLWRSYDLLDVKEVNTGALLATVAAADNTKTALFKPGVQTCYSMLLAMRSMMPRIRAFLTSQLRWGAGRLRAGISATVTILADSGYRDAIHPDVVCRLVYPLAGSGSRRPRRSSSRPRAARRACRHTSRRSTSPRRTSSS
jgi:hypothetical protein